MREGIEVLANAMFKLDSSQDIKTCLEHPFIKFLGVDFSAPSTSQDAMSRIGSALELISDLKDFMTSALSLIKQENKHQELRGFLLLPLDIIAIILSYLSAGACSKTQGQSYYKCDPKEVVAFSQTCRQFRKIALQIPSLWAGITFGRSMEYLNSCYIERSRSAGLSITISTNTAVSPEKYRSFIQTLLPHRQRWKSFHIKVSDTKSNYKYPQADHRELLRGIGKRCANICFPELRELVIEYCIDRLDEDSFMPKLDDSDSDFFSTWTVPLLRHVAVKNYLPRAVPFTSSITDLSIDITGFEHHVLLMEEFAQYLQLFPNVQTLKVNTDNITIYESGGPPTCLSELQSLTLCVTSESAELTGLQTLLASFEFPAVTRLNSRCLLPSSVELKFWLRALLEGPKFPNLTDLKIDYIVDEQVYWEFNGALSFAPKLKHLDFKLEESRSLSLSFIGAHYSRPSSLLQTMRLNLPSAFYWDNVHSFVDNLLRSTHDFKRLSIVGRPAMTTFTMDHPLLKNILFLDA